MSELFDSMKLMAEAHIKTLRAVDQMMNERICRGCRLPYPLGLDDDEERIKPFPVCDDCLEALKPIYQKRGELK